MKYLFSLLILLPIITSSQSLLNEDMLWSTAIGPGGNCGNFFCWSYYTKIDGDTTINDIQYKKVKTSNDSFMDKWTNKGFIREEKQQYFFRKINSETDCLLYDFGCSVGDTLNLNCSCLDNSLFKVDSIKYLPVLGEERKHIYLTYLIDDSIEGPTEYWIVGIGSIAGILNGGGPGNCMTGGSEMLLCCSKNGVEIFHTTDYDDCFLGQKIVNSALVNLVNDINLKIYPNPTTDEIIISNPSNIQIKKIELINYSGRIVQMWNAADCAGNTLNIQHISPGVYLLKAETDAGIKTEKLVVHQ